MVNFVSQLRYVKDWVRNGPSLTFVKKNFCEYNSISMPKIGYLISLLFKSPGPNMAELTFGVTCTIVFGIGLLGAFAKID